MATHEQIDGVLLAVNERATQLGIASGDEVVIELQTEVCLDVCTSREEPNLDRALKSAFDRYRHRLGVEAIFELSVPDSATGAASTPSSRILLKRAVSMAPVVPKSARDRCDSLARNAESPNSTHQRTETAPICAVLVSPLPIRNQAEQVETDVQAKRDTCGTQQRPDRRGNRKGKQADAEAAKKPATTLLRDPSPVTTKLNSILDILQISRSSARQSAAHGKQKSEKSIITASRNTVIGCSLLLEMYKRGAVGLCFKLKSGTHEHAELLVRLCVTLPIRFVDQPSSASDVSSSQPNAVDESVYGTYPFDRSGSCPDESDSANQLSDENEPQQEDMGGTQVVRNDLTVAELYEALREATLRQLDLAQQFAARFSKSMGAPDGDDALLFELCDTAAFVFRIPQPKGSYAYVNVMYPADVTRDGEAAFRAMRTELHSFYGVSTDRPAFRRAQAVFPSRRDATIDDDGLLSIVIGTSASGNSQRRVYNLIPSIHLAVVANEQTSAPAAKSTGSTLSSVESPTRLGLKRAFVRGAYAYFHYVCDGFDDVNWGCAYRSLQTLISWYVLNDWARIGVPTLNEIQRSLVACGDQEASLIGSRRWIGSTEVGLALQTMLASDGVDVTYKILFVSRGSELASHVRAILAHFEIVGTPVMIGGGQYAHTIIGAEFDELEGRTRFLILDPHYVGPESLPTIIKKGWCAWRDPATFFNDTTFYNLCMPQLPSSL